MLLFYLCIVLIVTENWCNLFLSLLNMILFFIMNMPFHVFVKIIYNLFYMCNVCLQYCLGNNLKNVFDAAYDI